MSNKICAMRKCDTCQDSCCKNGSCSICRENGIVPISADCHGYCATESVDQCKSDVPIPFSKILAINGLFYAGEDEELSAKRSDAVIIETQGKLNNILCSVFVSVVNGKLDLKRIEVIKAKEAPV